MYILWCSFLSIWCPLILKDAEQGPVEVKQVYHPVRSKYNGVATAMDIWKKIVADDSGYFPVCNLSGYPGIVNHHTYFVY